MSEVIFKVEWNHDRLCKYCGDCGKAVTGDSLLTLSWCRTSIFFTDFICMCAVSFESEAYIFLSSSSVSGLLAIVGLL